MITKLISFHLYEQVTRKYHLPLFQNCKFIDFKFDSFKLKILICGVICKFKISTLITALKFRQMVVAIKFHKKFKICLDIQIDKRFICAAMRSHCGHFITE